jgi:hypothetical protein
MKKVIEKLFFIEDKQVLKWGRFNAYMNLFFGFIAFFSPVFIMTVVQEKANQIANTRRTEADSLKGLNLFDSGDEFNVISYHLDRDAGMIQQMPEVLSVLIFFIGFVLIHTGINQLKLYDLVKEKEAK